MYKIDVEMLVQKLVQFAEFGLRQRIDCTRWRFGAFHEVDFQIIQSVRSEGVCLLFTEDVRVPSVLLWDRQEVLLCGVQGVVQSRGCLGHLARQHHTKGLRPAKSTSPGEHSSIHKGNFWFPSEDRSRQSC